MTDVQDLIKRMDAYAEAAGLSPRTVSKKVFLDAHRIDQLRRDPSRIQLDTVERARTRMARLEAAPVRRRRKRRAS
ncbi:MAG: hypothetical protein NW203_03695 [Hyphomonadaceae bacterium]|nr:hypothetical protein [Hyphomonadaceae bacterium]